MSDIINPWIIKHLFQFITLRSRHPFPSTAEFTLKIGPFLSTHNSLLLKCLRCRILSERGTQCQLHWEVEPGEPSFVYGDRLLLSKWEMRCDPS